MSPRMSPQRFSGSEAAKQVRKEKRKARPESNGELPPPSKKVSLSILAAVIVITLWATGFFSGW